MRRQRSAAGTGLADLVSPSADVVVVGLQSEFCVRATALDALGRGHRTALVRGAHATYDDGDTPAATVSLGVEVELAAAGVAVLDTADVVFS